MMTNLVVGLDCGASHSTVTVWEEGTKVLERHDWPGANYDLIEMRATKDYFLLEFEKLEKFKNAYWVVGMAGLDDSKEVNAADRWFRGILEQSIPFSGLKVMSDIELVLWAGSSSGQGIGLIAGTGSNCLGKDSTGKTKKVGGMSHLLSDEGSGFSLGWRGLHLFSKMSDGRESKTDLYNEILDFFKVTDQVDLKNYLLSESNHKVIIAACAPIILAASDRGDFLAEKIVREESMELVKMVSTVNETFLNETLPVFLAGSIFKNINYRDQFILNLHKFFPSQTVRTVSPIEGAVSFHNSVYENTLD
jgi:N-acetylglucosamine kinase-like BadF-type ATPase